MQIEVTYRRTSRLSMRIGKGGVVRVSAPIGISKSQVEAFISENREWISKAIERTSERQTRRKSFFDSLPLTTRKECDDALERLHELIPPMVERYSKIMGVAPRGISYKPTISKWGSCNVLTKRLQFSAYLLLLPEWCVEHVVVHELAHLIEPSHNARFHALMDRYYPRWREAHKETIRLSRQ